MNVPSKRVCLLTGAGGQLGSAFCRLQAERYDIVAVYRSRPPDVPSQLQHVIDPLNPSVVLEMNRAPVFVVRADLSDSHQLERVIELTLARFDSIDLVVNAASRCTPVSFLDTNRYLAEMEPEFQTNVIVPLRIAGAIVRAFWLNRAEENVARNRNIVNVSSISGMRVWHGHSVYAASKAALNHLTCHLAHELKKIGVRINATAPTSFPRLIPTERVVECITAFDRGSQNGEVLVLESSRTSRS